MQRQSAKTKNSNVNSRKSPTIRNTTQKKSVSISKKQKQQSKHMSSKTGNRENTHKTNNSIQSNNIQGSKHSKGSRQDIDKISTISKDNFDVIDMKINITQIKELDLKYSLKCIEGLFKNRALYITTHKEGEIVGSGDAREYGLTLQIEGVGLEQKHCKLKFNGIKKFYIKDYNTQKGTWLNIPEKGQKIKHGQIFIIGEFHIRFELGEPIDEIQELCIIHNCHELCDRLKYNDITSLAQLYKAEYQNFNNYPFTNQEKNLLREISLSTKQWYDQQNMKTNQPYSQQYKRVNAFFMNTNLDITEYSIEIGWEEFYFPVDSQKLLIHNCVQRKERDLSSVAVVSKGKLLPPPKTSIAKNKVFTKILAEKYNQVFLHDQVMIGDLLFQLNRYNYGVGSDPGTRSIMEDVYIIEQDVGGSEWKLISLFAIMDGYGGSECVDFIKSKLLKKIRQWTPMLDEAGDLNTMLKLLMFKTFYEIDYEFYQSYPQLSMTCGATAMVLLIIDSRAYVFNLGDNKGIIYRNESIYHMSIDQIPSRIDEKGRIQQQGGFLQYNRLMGKCTLSRTFGQFQYKDIEDYKNSMKGKLKSYLSCQPEVVSFILDPTIDDFIFLSTDGIIDALNLKTIVNYIVEKEMLLESDENPNKIVSSLIENSKITNNHDCDNMAAILIFIRKGKIGAKSAW